MKEDELPIFLSRRFGQLENTAIRRTVAWIDMVSTWAPHVVVVMWVIAFLVGLVLRGLGNAVLVAAVTAVLGAVSFQLLEPLLLQPLRVGRYRRAAGQLAAQAGAAAMPCSLLHSWWSSGPGALAVSADGHVVLIDRSSDFQALLLRPVEIFGVSLIHITVRISSAVEVIAVELRYHSLDQRGTRTATIPFGADRRGADRLREVISQLKSGKVEHG